MKFKTIFILYTLLLCAVLIFGYYSFHSEEEITFDVVTLHKASSEIEEAIIQSPTDIPEDLLQTYHCSLLYLSDSNYEEKLWSSLQNEDILIDIYDSQNAICAKAVFSPKRDDYLQKRNQLWRTTLILTSLLAILGYLLLIMTYQNIIHPFENLQSITGAIAKGNFDIPLPMQKNNYFGAFTESFDILREELAAAKQREYFANQSKKELVAELSHDIKTPLATIRANCELLSVLTQNEKISSKIKIIDNKSYTIEQLINNLFSATMEELQLLNVNPVEESSLQIQDMFDELSAYAPLHFHGVLPAMLIYMDKLRFSQVLDNIIFNSFKYAGTDIDITYEAVNQGIMVRIADHGPGVPEDELPLLSSKFYRGSNATTKQGSGLGLYLSHYFMEQMDGELNYYNSGGFVVELYLKKI